MCAFGGVRWRRWRGSWRRSRQRYTQITCFACTKVQILTAEELGQMEAMERKLVAQQAELQELHAEVLSILALLVQKYQY
jgi:hypothetical protein